MDIIHQIDTNQYKLTICSEQFSNMKLQVMDELPAFSGFQESEVYSKNIFEGISISEDNQDTVSSWSTEYQGMTRKDHQKKR